MKTKDTAIHSAKEVKFDWGDYDRLAMYNGYEVWRCPPQGIFLVVNKIDIDAKFFSNIEDAFAYFEEHTNYRINVKSIKDYLLRERTRKCLV